MLFLLGSMLFACKGDGGPDADADTDADSDTDADTDSDTDSDTDTDPVDTAADTDTDTDTDTDEPPPAVDCSVLPTVPRPFTTLTGYSTAEDFDFDGQGYHVSLANNGTLIGIDIAGDTVSISPNVSNEPACTRMLPSGDFVVCDVASNSLVRVDRNTGAKFTLLSGMSYPNGAEVDPDGFVYVAEQNAGRVRRIDSVTGDFTTIAENLNAPNGVIFSPDWNTLYVGSFGGGTVYAIDRTGIDTFDTPRVLAQDSGPNGGFDGINVDECGNIYITEFIVGRVYRITPDGQTIDLVADLPSTWIPNMRWGTGRDGWDDTLMYVSDREQGRLFAIDIGFRGKPAFVPPSVP